MPCKQGTKKHQITPTMHRHLRTWLAALTLPFALGVPQADAYTHPCIPNTLEELDTIKASLNQEPWKSGYAVLAGDGHSQLTYTMQGPHANVSRAGAYDQYLGAWRNDMVAVYNLARMSYFTGNADYAQKAHDILLQWATVHTSFTGNESGLDLGDYAVCYAGGASILRGTWSGWTAADTTTVQNYFSNVLWPATLASGNVLGPANKGALYMAAGISIAAFCDDTAKFNQIVNLFRTDHAGGLPNTLPIGEIGETGRDLGHGLGTLSGLTFTAEVAWKQGIDLYSELDNRLLACGEYYARNTLTTDNPFVPFGTIDYHYYANNAYAYTANRGPLYLIQNAYKNRKGLPTPWIDRKLEEQPADGGNFMYAKTADFTTATVTPASFPPVSLASSGLTLTTLGTQTTGRSAAYASGVWTVAGLGSGVWNDTTDDCQFVYQTMTGDCAIVAKVTSCTYSGTNNGKAGLMIRDTLTGAFSKRAWVGIVPAATRKMEAHMRGWSENWGSTGRDDRSQDLPPGMPYWLRIERRGGLITTFASQDGTSCAQFVLRYPPVDPPYRPVRLQRKYDDHHRHLRQCRLHRRHRRPGDDSGRSGGPVRFGLRQGRHRALAAVLRRHRLRPAPLHHLRQRLHRPRQQSLAGHDQLFGHDGGRGHDLLLCGPRQKLGRHQRRFAPVRRRSAPRAAGQPRLQRHLDGQLQQRHRARRLQPGV